MKVERVIRSIKDQVIESKGFMYQLDTVDKFNDTLELSDNPIVSKLRQEIEDAI